MDQVDNLKSLIDIINKRNFGKESNLNAIKMVFNTRNGLFNIDSLKAYHDNLRLTQVVDITFLKIICY